MRKINIFLFISSSQMPDSASVRGWRVVSLIMLGCLAVIPCWLLLLDLHMAYWVFIPKEQTGADSNVHVVIRLF